MRRESPNQPEAAGHDSFLDVTTNIVGILIILVVVVGIRASNLPPPAPPVDAEAKQRVESLGQQVTQVEYDVRRIQQQLESLELETARRALERQELAAVFVAAERSLDDRRLQLDAAAKEEFDLRRQIDQATSALRDQDKQRAELDSEKPPTEVVNHYPTPISRTVLGKEIHFQLKDGRIAYVPVDEFVDDVRDSMRSAATRPGEVNRVAVVGPRNGFEFHYTMESVVDRGRGLFGIRTREWQLVPVGIQQGEPIDAALDLSSQFRVILARNNPSTTAITLWTYPESFADYRRVKEELYRLGYATAGRPMPEGVLIGGSDRGTKSSAQ